MRVVFCVDGAGKIVRSNGASVKVTGGTLTTLQGIPLQQLFYERDRPQISNALEQTHSKNTPLYFKASLLLPSGCATAFNWLITRTKSKHFTICTGTSAPTLNACTEKCTELPLSNGSCFTAAPTPQLQDPLYVYLNQMSDALLALDNNWRYTYVNKKAGELLERHDLLHKHIWSEFPDAVGGAFYNAALHALEQQEYTEITSYNEPLKKWFERRMYPSTNGLLIFFSDITEKKLAEQKAKQVQKELQNFHAALNASSNVSVTDTEGVLTWANDNFCKLSECSPNELIGQKHGILSSPFNTADFTQSIIDTFKQGKVWKGEIQNRTKDGSVIWVHSTIVPVLDERGEPTHNIVFCQDITEKKRAEKELRESEKLYRTLIENYSDMVLLTDLQGNIKKANKVAEAVSTISCEALQQKNFLEFVSPEDRRKISTALPLLLEGKNLQLKIIISCFDKPFSAMLAIVPIKDEGTIRYFFVKFRDISKKVDYEKDLILLNESTLALSTSATLKEGTNAVIKLLCRYGDFQYGEFWMPLFGQHMVKMKSSWWSGNDFRIMHAASEYNTFNMLTEKPEIFGSSKWYFSGNIQEDKCFRRKAEASRCGIKSFLSIPIIYRRQLLGVVCLFSTKQHSQPQLNADRLQELLSNLGGELERRNSAEELDRFFSLSPELLGILGFDSHIKKFNPAFQQFLGYTEEEMKSVVVRDIIHQDDQLLVGQVREQMLLGRAFKNLELRYRCKDGNYRWLSCSTQPVVQENLYYLTARDITDQKQQIAEFERVKIAIDSTSDAIGVALDMENLLYVNKAFEKLLGWRLDNLNALGWPKVFVQPDLPYKIVQIMSETGHWEGDLELFDTVGNIRSFNLRANTFTGKNSTLSYLVGVFTDISVQKQAQREVVRLSKAVEESANEIYIYNIDTLQFTYTNKRAQQNLGYSAEEFEWLTPENMNPGYSRLSYQKMLLPLIRGKVKSIYFKTMHLRKNGSAYPAEIHLSWFKDGATNSLMAHVIDITEQREAEKALLLSNERYQLVTKATNDAIWDFDVIEQLCYYGEGYKTIFGHAFGNSYAGVACWAECLHPEDAERVMGNFHDVVVQGLKEWVIEYRFKCGDGTYRFVRDRGYVIYDSEGNATRMAGALADVSEQKRNENLLREFNAELEKKVDEKTSKLGHALRLMRQEVIAKIRIEENLQQSLQEKEVLLKEIHHRVKNNMAIISGLLSLQARHVKQEEFRDVLKDSQSRIKSMALIHELLYQNENLARIKFREYIHKLVEGISHSFHAADKGIELIVEAEDEELDIVQAVPCGLILNELITNSFKYAFSGKQKGLIKISFVKANSHFMLSVLDNGIGLPKGFDPRKTKTLGMQLVSSLIRQIGGEMSIIDTMGTMFVFAWKE